MRNVMRNMEHHSMGFVGWHLHGISVCGLLRNVFAWQNKIRNSSLFSVMHRCVPTCVYAYNPPSPSHPLGHTTHYMHAPVHTLKYIHI